MVNTRSDNASTKQSSRSSWQLQSKKLVLVEREESELDPIKMLSSKRRNTASSVSLDHGLLTPKTEDLDTVMQTDIPEKRTTEDSQETVELMMWRGNVVGREAKELLEAVEHHYPNTFLGVKIRVKPTWLVILEDFHATIKRFMGTSVDAITKEQITNLEEDLNELEGFRFDLLWARKRLDIIHRLKFGNEPLHNELMALEGSIEPLKAMVDMRWKQLMEAHDMYKTALLEYDNAIDARKKKAQEVAQMFGADFDRILKGHLGLGLLPGY